MARLAALLLAATLLCGLAAAAAGQQRVLVLLDDPAMEQSHSSFLKGLSGRGYQLDIKPITDKSLQLKTWDEWLYDKAVILGSGKGEEEGRAGVAVPTHGGRWQRTQAAPPAAAACPALLACLAAQYTSAASLFSTLCILP